MPVFDDQKEKSDQHQGGVDDAQRHYDREFGGIVDNYNKETEHPLADQERAAGSTRQGGDDSEQKNSDGDKNDEQPKDGEQSFKFRPDSAKQSRGRRLSGKLFGTRRRRITTAVALTGAAGLLSGTLFFSSLPPLKIVSLVNNARNVFASASENATDKMSDRLVDKYIVNKVFPELSGKGKCRNTISPACTFRDSSGKGPVSRLYHAWHDAKLEQKLATKYGMVFGRDVHGKYYMTVNGHDLDLKNGPSGRPSSIFDFADSDKKNLSRAQVRSILRDRLSQETKSKRLLFRYTYGKMLERKYGVKRCTVACGPQDFINDKKVDLKIKKQAAKAYVARKVLTPLSQNYASIIGCIIDGTTTGICSTEPEKVESGDADAIRETGSSQGIKEQLATYRSGLGSDSLEKLVNDINSGQEKGLSRFLVKEIADRIGKKLGVEAAGEIASKAASKAIPVAGWIMLALQLRVSADTIPSMLKYLSYASNAAATVQLYELYNSAASEIQSGNTDPAIVASLSESLTTNLSGSTEDRSDMTETNFYRANYVGGEKKSTVASSLLPGTALAASSPSRYLCGDGTPEAANVATCPDARLVQDNTALNGAQEAINWINRYPLAGLPVVVAKYLVNAINGITGLLGEGLMALCNSPVAPGCSDVAQWVGEKSGEMMSWLFDTLLGSPFTENMSGGRTGDLVSAGADVSYNKMCQAKLGCQRLTNAQSAAIRNEELAKRKDEFAQKPMFARMFDRTSPYSFVSRLAVSMPDSMQTFALSGVGSILQDPFAKLGSSLASIFSVDRAFAAEPATDDPFGVIQYGYPEGTIPNDPAEFWDKNCGGESEEAFQEKVATWANYQQIDENTGEAVAEVPQACLLIKTTVGAVGGMYDTSLIGEDLDSTTATAPANSENTDCASEVGNAKIACEAQQFFGYPYGFQDSRGSHCYGASGGNGPGGANIGYPGSAWIALLKKSPDGKTLNGKDICIGCSGFVNAAIYAAFGQDFSYCSADYYRNDKNFRIINKNNVQAGDLLILNPGASCGTENHIAIVKSYDSNSGKLVTLESSAGENVDGKVLSGVYTSRTLGYFGGAVRYIGPGSG